jgi:hypothetical protein
MVPGEPPKFARSARCFGKAQPPSKVTVIAARRPDLA